MELTPRHRRPRPSRSWWGRASLAGVGVVTLVTVAACGSGSSSPAASATGTPTGTSTGQVAYNWGQAFVPPAGRTAASPQPTTSSSASSAAATSTAGKSNSGKGAAGKKRRRGRRSTAGGFVGPPTTSPAKVTGISGTIVQVSTSNTTSYALTSAGTVWAWGNNSAGQFGNGTTGDSTVTTAVQVHFPSGVRITSLPDPMPASGGMAIDSTHTAWAWGNNDAGQFCQTSSGLLTTPTKVPLPDVTLAAGALVHGIYDSDGHIVTCGRSKTGALGTGAAPGTEQSTATAVKGLPDATPKAVTAAWGNAGVLYTNGAYYDWGYNHSGQDGDGSTTAASTAVHVSLPGAVSSVSEGGSTGANGQTIALLTDGSVVEWGDNADGQLGNHSTADATRPITLSQPSGVHFTFVNSGGATMYALTSTGELWSWGRNAKGEIGNGTRGSNVEAPVDDHVSLRMVTSTATNVDGYAGAAPTSG